MPVLIDGAYNKPESDQHVGNRVYRVYSKATILEPSIMQDVIGVSDWKGHLQVLWKEIPTCGQMAAFKKAWDSEYEDQISHWIRNENARDQFAEIEIKLNLASPYGSQHLLEMYEAREWDTDQ
jgi:hypothetical protein